MSINYREGMLYSPLENYSYTCYLPQTIMLLCGLRDGSNIITAENTALSSLSDSVTVHVETLKNKLYLLQFTPAVETQVSYEDGLGETHTVCSSPTASLPICGRLPKPKAATPIGGLFPSWPSRAARATAHGASCIL